MLVSGELNPRHQHGVFALRKRLTCEADSLGSHGLHLYCDLSDASSNRVNLRTTSHNPLF